MRVLLCDLDDTLFDHQHATRSALARLRAIDDRLQAWSLEDLKVRHHQLLEQFHQEVLAGRLTIDEAREQRFQALVGDTGGGRGVAGLAQAYRQAYTEDWREVPGAAALLRAVRAAGAAVVIVTNNIIAEQRMKLDRIGLSPLVDVLMTSEEAGVQKPDPRIFQAALASVDARAQDAVMLGDAWKADVEGALASGIRPVWFNRYGQERLTPTVDEVRALAPHHEVLSVLMADDR